MARPSKYETLNLNPEKVRAAWTKFGSTAAIADEWDCSKQTVRKIFKKVGIDYKDLYISRPRANFSKFAEWLRNHDEVLPRSLKEISDISNTSYDTVKAYFYREQDVRYREWEAFLKEWVPKQTKFNKVKREDLAGVSFKIDRFDFRCILKLKTKDGEEVCYVLPDSLKESNIENTD